MGRFLLICLGGAAGTGARYLIGTWGELTPGGLPYRTLAVNLIGSFLMGVVMHLGLNRGVIAPDLRVVLATGVLGGFTTYSAFNYETTRLLQDGSIGLALLYLAVTLVGCLVAGVLGLVAARLLAGA